jgi:hypothetical protein
MTQSYLKTEMFYAKCCSSNKNSKVYRYFPDVFFAIFSYFIDADVHLLVIPIKKGAAVAQAV